MPFLQLKEDIKNSKENQYSVSEFLPIWCWPRKSWVSLVKTKLCTTPSLYTPSSLPLCSHIQYISRVCIHAWITFLMISLHSYQVYKTMWQLLAVMCRRAHGLNAKHKLQGKKEATKFELPTSTVMVSANKNYSIFKLCFIVMV